MRPTLAQSQAQAQGPRSHFHLIFGPGEGAGASLSSKLCVSDESPTPNLHWMEDQLWATLSTAYLLDLCLHIHANKHCQETWQVLHEHLF